MPRFTTLRGRETELTTEVVVNTMVTPSECRQSSAITQANLNPPSKSVAEPFPLHIVIMYCFRPPDASRRDLIFDSHGVDLAGILGGRIARAEGGLVPSGVGYGEGCPLFS